MKNFLLILLALSVLPVLSFAQTSPNDFPVDLLFKSDTFTPAGFNGKALPIKFSPVTVVAITPTQSTSQLSYTWLVKDSSSSLPGADKEGIGENSFSFRGETIIPGFKHIIRVNIKNLRTGAEATKQIEIQLTDPEVHLYEDGPWGLKTKGETIARPGSIFNFFAKPFYFNTKNIGDLIFSWSFDNQEVFGSSDPDKLSLSISDSTAAGTERGLGVTVVNSKIAESLRERVSIFSNLLILP